MVPRYAAFLLLLLSASTPSQTSAQSDSQTIKSFSDPALGITYFYPGNFTPASPTKPAVAKPAPQASDKTGDASPQCVRSLLSAGSTNKLGTTVFVVSSVDSSCPGILKSAEQPETFTRDQILRQLKRYGTPVITQDPAHYTVDGHPAAITFASVQPEDLSSGNPAPTTYAAKACVLGYTPVKGSRKSYIDPTTQHVLCFDFTTQQRDLLTLMLSFSLQFDAGMPGALVPGSVLR
jgi:hypothetical protein